MENLFEIDAHGAVVRVGFHNICHEIPPFPVDGGVSSFGPALLILDLDVAEKSQRFFVQKDGVILSAIFMDHVLHLRPELIVTLLVLGLLALIQFHFKSFNHCKTLLEHLIHIPGNSLDIQIIPVLFFLYNPFFISKSHREYSYTPQAAG